MKWFTSQSLQQSLEYNSDDLKMESVHFSETSEPVSGRWRVSFYLLVCKRRLWNEPPVLSRYVCCGPFTVRHTVCLFILITFVPSDVLINLVTILKSQELSSCKLILIHCIWQGNTRGRIQQETKPHSKRIWSITAQRTIQMRIWFLLLYCSDTSVTAKVTRGHTSSDERAVATGGAE